MRLYFIIGLALFFFTACTRLDQPTDIKAVAVNDSTVKIEWKDWSKGEDGYLIYEAKEGRKPEAASRKPADCESGEINGREPGTSYEYYVVAIHGDKQSLPSQKVVVVMPNYRPQAPLNLVAQPVSATEVALSWSDNNSRDLGFEIQRREDRSTNWSTIKVVGAKINQFSDRNLDPGKTYYYRVRAAGGGYFSDFCNETMTVTFEKGGVKVLYPNGGEVLSGPELKIRFTADPTFGGLRVYFYTADNYWFKAREWAKNDGLVIFNDFASLIPSKTYKVRISSSDPTIYDDSDGFFEIVKPEGGSGK